MQSSPPTSPSFSDRTTSAGSLSIKSLFKRFKWRVSFTLSLVVGETLLELLYPLFIGLAINDLLRDSFDGLIYLGILGVTATLIGTARRFYDTRIYASMYQTIAPELVEKEQSRNSSTSTIAARTNLLNEFVEFFENSIPAVVTSLLGLIGVLIIICTLNLKVFFACLGLISLVILIYLVTGKLNYKLNAAYNSELEKRVNAIESANPRFIDSHFRSLMKWNIKLSDLETGNFFFIWIGIIALFIYTPIAAIDSSTTNYGLIFSLLMYVFDYIEKVATLPLFVQQIIRLKEIANRLRENNNQQ